MRLPLTIIVVAINILIFTTLAAFLMSRNYKGNQFSTAFFLLMEAGMILNTVLICTAR
ncbi:hypothetical protein [Blautia obeum]|jgi:hypothetical protein|uniref:hypothetical protein n=1 Tax=Blautia obeum TaxID=40520 RepID=UPI00321A4EEE